jgi:glycosyltransferase involved in cell wall biosynthesis
MAMGQFIKQKYPHAVSSGALELPGRKPPRQLAEEMLNARVILMPSTIENLPYTVVEAMATGAVVLAARQGGQGEIIEDRKNGLLFDHNEPDSLADCLLEAANLTVEQRTSIASEAIATIRRLCDPQNYFEQKKKILDGAVGGPSREFPFSFKTEAAQPISRADPGGELLSIVIPYYNMGPFLQETIDSIDQSLHKEKEIIIVNDGSNDPQSVALLDHYRSRRDIRIIDQVNSGLSLARNAGAREAQGSFLAFLDADDKVHASYYREAIRILRGKDNVHFVGCWVKYFGNSDNRWPAFTPEPPLLFYHNMVNSSGLVYKSTAFHAAGRNDPQFVYGMEDYDSVINLVENGYHGVVIPEFYFYYRVRKNSMSRGFNASNQQYLYDVLARKHQKFYATFAAELFGLLNANGPGIMKDNPSLDHHLANKIPFGGRLSRRAIQVLKKNDLARKIAFRVYRFFK